MVITKLPDLYIRLDKKSCTPGKTIPCGNVCRQPQNCKTKNRVTEANKELRRSFANRMRQEKTKDRPFKKLSSQNLDEIIQRATEANNKFNALAKKSQDLSAKLKQSIEQTSIVDYSKGSNNIINFGLRTQSRLLGRIDRQMQELQGLAQQFEEARTAKDAIDAIKETGKLFDEVKGKFSELQGAKLDRDRRKLERTYKGLVDRLTAKAAALNKRVFELSNPHKLVKMPKGSTQIDFVNAIDKLTLGDRKAIKEFTVPRPAKAKKPAKRKK